MIEPRLRTIDKNLGLVRGADGYSPTVSVEDIEGGHRVTITDAEHPEGQPFDVMDGSGGGSGTSDWSDIRNKPTTLSGYGVTVDSAPTANSQNPVTSGGIYAALQSVDNSEEMTLAEYEALTQAEKMDGTVRYITDVSTFPDASGVGF